MKTTSFRKSPLFRSIAFMVLTAFAIMLPVSPSYAQVTIVMPPPGQMIHITRNFEPPQMVGLKINLKDPFSFDFIMDQGESPMSDDVRKEEFNKIIKYFLVSLAMPNKDMWVNLSPYESNRIIPEVFAQTEMGRDLLAQDYILKQFTASLMYPEDGLGKKFWDKVYAQAQARFGTTDINVNTFNKVWIVADHADIYQKGDTAFLVNSHLKVMLEQDYMAIEKNKEQFGNVNTLQDNSKDAKGQMASQLVREIIIPAIEKEVNEGKSFAAVRQVYNAEIMATWFKKTLRQSLLGQVFVNKSKISGQRVDDPQAKEKIYQQYLKAYKKGVFNYIKEDTTPDGQVLPRKYFSGGMEDVDEALVSTIAPADLAMSSKKAVEVKIFFSRAKNKIKKWALVSVLFAANIVGAAQTLFANPTSQPAAPLVIDLKIVQKQLDEQLRHLKEIDENPGIYNKGSNRVLRTYFEMIEKRMEEIGLQPLKNHGEIDERLVCFENIRLLQGGLEMYKESLAQEGLHGITAAQGRAKDLRKPENGQRELMLVILAISSAVGMFVVKNKLNRGFQYLVETNARLIAYARAAKQTGTDQIKENFKKAKSSLGNLLGPQNSLVLAGGVSSADARSFIAQANQDTKTLRNKENDIRETLAILQSQIPNGNPTDDVIAKKEEVLLRGIKTNDEVIKALDSDVKVVENSVPVAPPVESPLEIDKKIRAIQNSIFDIFRDKRYWQLSPEEKKKLTGLQTDLESEQQKRSGINASAQAVVSVTPSDEDLAQNLVKDLDRELNEEQSQLGRWVQFLRDANADLMRDAVQAVKQTTKTATSPSDLLNNLKVGASSLRRLVANRKVTVRLFRKVVAPATFALKVSGKVGAFNNTMAGLLKVQIEELRTTLKTLQSQAPVDNPTAEALEEALQEAIVEGTGALDAITRTGATVNAVIEEDTASAPVPVVTAMPAAFSTEGLENQLADLQKQLAVNNNALEEAKKGLEQAKMDLEQAKDQEEYRKDLEQAARFDKIRRDRIDTADVLDDKIELLRRQYQVKLNEIKQQLETTPVPTPERQKYRDRLLLVVELKIRIAKEADDRLKKMREEISRTVDNSFEGIQKRFLVSLKKGWALDDIVAEINKLSGGVYDKQRLAFWVNDAIQKTPDKEELAGKLAGMVTLDIEDDLKISEIRKTYSTSPRVTLLATALRKAKRNFVLKSRPLKDNALNTAKHVGGINLSDEHLTINIKVDGAGMPLPAQYQDKAMMNLDGLTSIIRKITPITPENVPALYDLVK